MKQFYVYQEIRTQFLVEAEDEDEAYDFDHGDSNVKILSQKDIHGEIYCVEEVGA